MEDHAAQKPDADKRGSRGAGSTWHPFVPVVWAVVGVAVVLIAARGVQLLLPAARLSAGWAVGLRAVGAVTVVAGIAGLLYQRSRLPARGPGRADPTATGLRTAGTIMAAVALLGLFNPPPPGTDVRRPGFGFGLIEVSPFGREGSGGEGMRSRTRGGVSPIRGEAPDVPEAPPLPTRAAPPDPGFARRAAGLLSRIFLFLAIPLAILYLMRRTGRRRPEEWEIEPPLQPPDAFAGLSASLEELEADHPQPRGQITRAYARLLESLAAAGAARAPYEAPHEHLYRALSPLGVRPDALHRLAGLYVLAQFGGRPVTDDHRTAAAEALSQSLADLRRGGSSGSLTVRFRAGGTQA